MSNIYKNIIYLFTKKKKKNINKINNISLEKKEQYNLHIFRKLLQKHTSELSGIYLIKLGTIEEIQKIYKINNINNLNISRGDFVYKYGRSKLLERRINDHIRDYGKYFRLELIYYAIIDNDEYSLSQAEAKLKNHFSDKKLDIEGRSELVILNNNDLIRSRDFIEEIRKEYYNNPDFLANQLLLLEKDYNFEICKREYENNLLKKEIEILNLKIKLN